MRQSVHAQMHVCMHSGVAGVVRCSYEEEDTCHMRRRIHATGGAGVVRCSQSACDHIDRVCMLKCMCACIVERLVVE